MADIRISSMPQVGSKAGQVLDRSVAQNTARSTYAGQAAPPTSEMDGLLRGLSQFNAELGRYTDQAIATDRAEQTAHAQRRAQAAAAAADASSPEAIQRSVAADIPADVPVAYGGIYREALGALLVDRNAIKAKTDWAAAYEEARKDPSFDAERFIAEQRQKSLAGLTDPGLAGRLAQHLNEMEGSARVAAERERVKKVDEATNTGLFSAMQNTLRADMSPEQWGEQYRKYMPLWEALGKSKKELAGMLFQRAAFVSDQMGGNPAVFDVFNSVDPATGQSLLALNPELQGHVLSAREAAKAKNQAMLREAAQSANLPTRVELDKLLETNPAAITMELVQRHMGPLGIFQTTDEAAAFLHKARIQQEKLLGNAEVSAGYDAGILGRFKPEDQQKELERRWGGAITAAWQRAVQGDGNAMAGLSAFLLSEQNRVKATVPVEAITRLIQSSVTTTQNPEGPGPEFAAMASLYRGLSADPKFRGMYFKDDAAQLMDQYLTAVDGGADPKAAYAAAYRATSPEAKEAARKMVGSPDFEKKLKKVHEAVTGVTFADRWVPFWGGTPSNQQAVQAAAGAAVRDFVQANPWATDKQAVEYASTWVRDNFVFDRNSGVAVRVPAGSADETTAEALSEYSKRVAEAFRLGDRNDGSWSVQFSPPGAGDGNQLHVWLARDGVPATNLGAVPLASLRAAMVAEKQTTEQDRAAYGTLMQQYRAGKLDLEFVRANAASIEKARRLDLLPADTLKAIDAARLNEAKRLVDSIPKLSLGLPSFEHLGTVPTRSVKVDNKLTAQVAEQALGTGGHLGLAASLGAMGEAVMLRAYPDPNPNAGMNIGMGYNLKANAKNYRQDFARAGVPEDRIEAVARGEAQLTPNQAMKLQLVALNRYEKEARDAAESTAPGLWNRMTPHQRAVMIDVSWQTGDTDQFKKAWRALERGDAAAFAQETKVFYTDARGQRVEDKRRNELRAAMLAGDSAWMSTIQKYGGFPATAMDALALNQPKN